MAAGSIRYRYDGSFDGLLCCVFESYVKKEVPVDIVPQEEAQWSLYPEKWIDTRSDHAQRVYQSLERRISAEAQRFVQLGYLTCAPHKEMLLYRFIRLGYRHGSMVMNRLTDETVHALEKAVRHLQNEAYRLLEFVRFSEYQGALISIIEPMNTVLPLMSDHFCDRYPEERFLIYDKTHHMALVYQPYQAEIVGVEELRLPKADDQEQRFQQLWKRFYKTIAVEGRENAKCRMNHMPKRYWGCMTEFQREALPQGDNGSVLIEEKGGRENGAGTR